jgi:hypothetical protein
LIVSGFYARESRKERIKNLSSWNAEADPRPQHYGLGFATDAVPACVVFGAGTEHPRFGRTPP